jgi:hypothetical protein
LHSRTRLASLLCALLLRTEPGAAEPVIDEIRFDWSSYQQHARGSDIWPLAWCEDDHQYTSWGDGGGFGGTNTDGRVSLGFARVSGPYASFIGKNLWGGKNPVTKATFRGKTTSLFCLGGDLYAWLSPGTLETVMDWKQLIVSEDKGLSWQQDAFPASRVDGCEGCPGTPYTIDYGKNYAANTDGYVYTYWIEIQDMDLWDVQVPGVLWLSRAPVANRAFTHRGSWQWVTGFGSNQTPIWGSEARRIPVLEDPDGLMRGSAIYVPGLALYLMVTNHTERNAGHLAIWEARAPWGPWTLILKQERWPRSDPDAPVDPKFSFGSFSPKWFSADGRSGVFVWFGPDRWNSVRVDVIPVPEPGAVPAVATGLVGLSLCARRRARRGRMQKLHAQVDQTASPRA